MKMVAKNIDKIDDFVQCFLAIMREKPRPISDSYQAPSI